MAVLDDDALVALAGLSKSVYLSAATAQKQAERHPDIRPEDYSHVQRLIDHGMAVLEKNRTMVFVGSDPAGKFWRAVVKRTDDAREAYLVTFHRIKPNAGSYSPAARQDRQNRGTLNCGARRCP